MCWHTRQVNNDIKQGVKQCDIFDKSENSIQFAKFSISRRGAKKNTLYHVIALVSSAPLRPCENNQSSKAFELSQGPLAVSEQPTSNTQEITTLPQIYANKR